jgi:pilus assembly protein Flp/PilA
MRKFLNQIQKFGKDEEGAALVEYVVLLGILLAASLVIIGTIGGQITGIFTAVSGALTAIPGA